MRRFKEDFSSPMSSVSMPSYETFTKPYRLDKAKKFIKKIAAKKINAAKKQTTSSRRVP